MSYDSYLLTLPRFAIIRITMGRDGPERTIQAGFDTEEELRAYRYGPGPNEVAVQLREIAMSVQEEKKP